jgi:hypothetical protein
VTPKMPILSGRDLCRALAKIGYEIDHQTYRLEPLVLAQA